MSNLKQFTTPTLNLIHCRWVELVGYNHSDWSSKGSLVLQSNTNFVTFKDFMDVDPKTLIITLDGTDPNAANTTTALQFYIHDLTVTGTTVTSNLVGANELPLLKVTGGSTIKFARANTSFGDTSDTSQRCLVEQYSY